MLCGVGYVLCYYHVFCYLDLGQVGVSDHEQLNDDLRNRSKVWSVQS